MGRVAPAGPGRLMGWFFATILPRPDQSAGRLHRDRQQQYAIRPILAAGNVSRRISTVPTDRITRIEYLLNNLLNESNSRSRFLQLQHDAYLAAALLTIRIFSKGGPDHAPELEEGARDGGRLGRDSAIRTARLRRFYETWRTTVDPKSARVLPAYSRGSGRFTRTPAW